MSARRNLWCGLWAWESGLINTGQLVEGCKLWTQAKDRLIEVVLCERGWINRRDAANLTEQLAVRAGVAAGPAQAEGPDRATYDWPTIPDHVKRLLSAIQDAELQAAVAEAPAARGTVDTVILPAEQSAAPAGAGVPGATPAAGPRYTLTSLHASGGMGHVWLARDEHIGRDVALKELRAELAGVEALPDRFVREARITGQLEHPGIVPVYELGYRPDGQPFYAMRYMRGKTLTQACQEYHRHHAKGEDEPLELVQLLSAFTSVCNTVAYAHSHGIVHRDLKGENVVLGDFGEVIVLDWGLAKRLSDGEEAANSTADLGEHLPEHAMHTVMGQIIGTPGYMAPEQAEGRLDLIGPHTDIFGLGAMLYELLTGKAPFAGRNTIEVIRMTKRGIVEPPHTLCADVPPALEAACLKALQTDPAKRHASAGDLGREVQGWQDKQRREAEQALAQNRRLLQAMVDNSTEIMFAKDLEGHYILINKWYETTFNVDRATYIGQTDFGLFPPAMAEQYRANDRRVLESGQPLTVEEFDENHIWISVKFPILDPQGKAWAVGGMSTDVTSLRKLENELAATREQCRAILAVTTCPALVCGADGRVTAANAAAGALWPDQPLVGRHCLDLQWRAKDASAVAYTADDHPLLAALRTTAAPNDRGENKRLAIRPVPGANACWLLSLELLRAADGRPTGLVATLERAAD